MKKKEYQPEARHVRLRTRITKDKSKYNRNTDWTDEEIAEEYMFSCKGRKRGKI